MPDFIHGALSKITLNFIIYIVLKSKTPEKHTKEQQNLYKKHTQNNNQQQPT